MNKTSLKLSLAQVGFTGFLYAVGVVVVAIALMPGITMTLWVWYASADFNLWLRALSLGFSAALGYFIFGFFLIVLVGIIRIIFGLNLEPGEYEMSSPKTFQWALVNAFVLLLVNTFMDFMLLTPLMRLFFRLMGAKVGRHVQINSTFCADLSLLEIGDYSVIGGHATVIGHSFERGKLILRKVKIGKNVTIGLNSIILPGAEIGDNAMIPAGAVVRKNVKVAAGETYFEKR